jgi:hypothetical protein
MELNMFLMYTLMALVEEITPKTTFFKDRYFPTTEEDIFSSDKVLTEYQKGNQTMAAFVSELVGDIPVDRTGYEVHELQPAYIAPSRLLTLDDLKKRGFGEALFSGNTQAQRAAKLLLKDFNELDDMITMREEWMCAQTMVNNACEMQTYIDAKTKGKKLSVEFYKEKTEHIYTVKTPVNADKGDFFGIVKAMCRMLSKRGLAAADLVLGTQAADAISSIPKVQALLDNRRMEYGGLNPELTTHHGVAHMGSLNFGGFKLNLFDVAHSYVEGGEEKPYFPATSAMVTAPACGKLMYGQITQINHGDTDYSTIAETRVPKLVIDQDKDTRKLRLGTRPLAAPKAYCPYIYAPDFVK